MAETLDGTPIVFCCPPGTHERSQCGHTWLTNEQFFTPASAVWFSQAWIQAVWIMGHYPRWSVESADCGAFVRFDGDRQYVWRLTDEYMNDHFLRLGRWPD